MENRNLSRFWKGLSVWATLRRRPASLILAVLAGGYLLATPVQAQTYVPPGPGQDWDAGNSTAELSPDAENTDPSARYIYDPPGLTSLVREQAEQQTDTVAQNVEAKLWPSFGSYSETHECVCGFEGDDSDSNIVLNVIVNIGQLIRHWFSEWCSSRIDVSSKPFLFSQSDPDFVVQWNSGKTLVMED